MNKLIAFFIQNKAAAYLLAAAIIVGGIAVAPFNWYSTKAWRSPVAMDAIPDLGENQQIVTAEWAGQSPQDIEDQISFPLSSALLGLPGVKTIRSSSIIGLSSIYIIFDDDYDFYWTRSRVLEKLSALPKGLLPENVTPSLGPEATALGQIFWYTLEGRTNEGKPAGGWEPQEIRKVQDFFLSYALQSVKGVAEVGSIGGNISEYQINLNPHEMRQYGVSLNDVMLAVKNANINTGARTMEINRVEYLIRGVGNINGVSDLEIVPIKLIESKAVYLKDIATIALGPAFRRGGLDKDGAEAVGGVVVTQYGENPLEVINRVKAKISEIQQSLPEKTLQDGSISKLTIVPFYDRSELIYETLGTLETALYEELLISIIVILLVLFSIKTSLIISALLPIGMLFTFIAMKFFGIDANIVALSGIAIAIGVMSDVGIIFTENFLRHKKIAEEEKNSNKKLSVIIYESISEVAPAIVTGLLTTIISFLPVFGLEAAEGKLFRPLAFTKTFAIGASLIIGLFIIPAFIYLVYAFKIRKKIYHWILSSLLAALAVYFLFHQQWLALWLIFYIVTQVLNELNVGWTLKWKNQIQLGILVTLVLYLFSRSWLPLGPENSVLMNFIFSTTIVFMLLGSLVLVVNYYVPVLMLLLENRAKFFAIIAFLLLFSMIAWLGINKTLYFIPQTAKKLDFDIKSTKFWKNLETNFPGLGREFMPTLQEGSFLLMPSTMPHSGVEENIETIALLDKMISSIPEVKQVVGKWGRVNSALDPAPISMYENVINYKAEYALDINGRKLRFKTDKYSHYALKNGKFLSAEEIRTRKIPILELIENPKGNYLRQWRAHIQNENDLWREIVAAAQIPGLTSAPKLQPIETRLVMLQTGMRSQLGIKVYGNNLNDIENFSLKLEKILKNTPSIEAASVFADRSVAKPYLEIIPNRKELARFGISVADFQTLTSAAIGGKTLSTSIEGRERYAIRVRYAFDFRNNIKKWNKILIPSPSGTQIPLEQLAKVQYKQGPQMIKSENGFLVSYVLFDKKTEASPAEAVENAQKFINNAIENNKLEIPAGLHYQFAGEYENQKRANERLSVLIPLTILIVFIIVYTLFKSFTVSIIAFGGIFLATAGGFIMLWLYSTNWFLNFSILDIPLRELFQIRETNISVAVWVGFIALFGIATDDGVLVASYLEQVFKGKNVENYDEIKNLVRQAGNRRVRPAIMTTAITLIALVPVLGSEGKGSEIMIPMAIPFFGGMLLQVITIFTVPLLYASWKEYQLKKSKKLPK